MSCKEQKAPPENVSQDIEVKIDTVVKETSKKAEVIPLEELADTTFIRLADYSEDFVYDLRYATENNFLKAKVYDCAVFTRV